VGAVHVPSLNLIALFEEQFGREAAYVRSDQFMIAYLSLSIDALPSIAREALRVAKQFWSGHASQDDLLAMRVRCWNYLGPREQEIKNPHRPAMRAVICTLYGTDTKHQTADADFLVDFFLYWVEMVEDHSHELEGLLKQHFCVPTPTQNSN
jgi:hypothetical protein